MSCSPGIEMDSIFRPWPGCRERRSQYYYFSYLESRRLGHQTGRISDTLLQNRLYRDTCSHRMKKATGSKSRKYSDLESPRSDVWSYDVESCGTSIGPTGGIYNLEFNTDGSILAAACERKNVVLFDPSTRRVYKSIENAHKNGVNCVRFLDNRTFATCSDDTTVALWDARYLHGSIRVLRGHNNWVKNIEYSAVDNCLVTSALDGSVFMWDINSYSESGANQKNLFTTNGLMRMCLTQHGDKMVITTMNGYIIVIHDLNLNHFESDMKDFKPNLYRLLQLSGGRAIARAANFTNLFHAKRNRVEFIADFAPGNEAEFISSLKLHPQGWVAVSRNVSADQESEWCNVHDIHAPAPAENEDEELPARPEYLRNCDNRSERRGAGIGLSRLAEFLYDNANPNSGRFELDLRESTAAGSSAQEPDNLEERDQSNEEESSSEEVEEEEAGEINNEIPTVSEGQVEGRPSVIIRSSSSSRTQNRMIISAFIENQLNRARRNRNSSSQQQGSHSEGGIVDESALTPKKRAVEDQAKIFQNRPRLTHYIQESNTGRGYIKEISFSHDGKVFCSPHDKGFRLLGFNEHLTDLSLTDNLHETTPRLLYEVGSSFKEHKDVVLTSAFYPQGFTIVTGSLDGSIVWHDPMP